MGWNYKLSEDVNLREIISVLRQLADRHAKRLPVSPKEVQKAKSIAAKFYLSHTNRKLTLNNEQFQLVIDILRIDDTFK